MSKRVKAKSRGGSRPARQGRWSLGWGLLVVLFAGGAVALWWGRQPSPVAPEYSPRRPGSITFNKDIAPIVFGECAGCHRPGESGPFNLLTYADVKKHARQIVEVTQSRFMPPWLPADGYEELLGKRRLTTGQIGVINQWAAEGAPEGEAADLPPLPKWTTGWQLGPPDLVVTLPEVYHLPAEGRDVYRNFIIPVPTTTNRFVRAVEFRPSSKAIHHAFIRLDRTHESRELDAKDPGPGFGGMTVPPTVETPAGHFLGWQPGRGPLRAPDGLAWTLPAGADIVLLMHMQLRGNAEPVQPSIGFYFTDVPPTNTPAKIGIRSFDIDIPAGATNYTVEKTVKLPVDTDLLAVLPHTHYLGKRLEGFTVSPDGTRKTLLLIPDWDFNWQSDYRFSKPVLLPKGTVLGMRYTYDNSTNNVRNPHHPPGRVKYGLQTTDEMGELHFQMLAHRAEDQAALDAAVDRYMLQDMLELSEHRLREDPTDAEAIAEIAKVRLTQGDLTGAEAMFRRVVASRPELADAHYSLGVVLLNRSKLAEAESEFLEALRLNPDDRRARSNAGLCCLRLGKLDEAAAHFQEVLRLHPDDAIAQGNLDLVLRTKRSELKAK